MTIRVISILPAQEGFEGAGIVGEMLRPSNAHRLCILIDGVDEDGNLFTGKDLVFVIDLDPIELVLGEHLDRESSRRSIPRNGCY